MKERIMVSLCDTCIHVLRLEIIIHVTVFYLFTQDMISVNGTAMSFFSLFLFHVSRLHEIFVASALKLKNAEPDRLQNLRDLSYTGKNQLILLNG